VARGNAFFDRPGFEDRVVACPLRACVLRVSSPAQMAVSIGQPRSSALSTLPPRRLIDEGRDDAADAGIEARTI
jgi:hypothetical protein